MNADARLDELSKDEFWGVARKLRPDLTRDDFDLLWEQFARDKALRAMQ